MDVQGLSFVNPESVRETFEVLGLIIFYGEVLLLKLAAFDEARRRFARKRRGRR